MSILHVEHVTHAFGDKTIFRDLSFRLQNHERVGLIGPNGAGKSTLIRILSGEILPDDGTIDWLTGIEIGHLQQHIDLQEGETLRDFLRGAFADLYALEAEMIALTQKMADPAPRTESTRDLDAMLNRYAAIQETLDLHDFYSLEAKLEEVAHGLGLHQLGFDTCVEQLSGGQRTKLLLAKLLLQKPQVLLLDEPTNYLDTEHIEWLTSYLKNYPHAFVLISHDTHFLNEVVNIIYHLEHQRLTRYVGNYQQFLAQSEQRHRQLLQAYSQQQREIQKLETYIAKNKVRTSTAKQAKSREKRLGKIERIEKPSGQPKPLFRFGVSVEPTRVVLETRALEVGYEKANALLPPLSLTLKRGAKIALVGYNGIGKTTSLKTMLGLLPSLGGDLRYGERVQPAYFAQEAEFKAGHSALEEVWRSFPGLTQKAVRQALARCGLKAEHILQPLTTLSGGEQTKVRLCKLMLTDSNWLVLDEPTNHLDRQAKEALKEALTAYPGTVLLVTHEPEFYAGWVTEVWDVQHWRDQASF
jgi:ATPase subunit of ABC transporter with duplicated ATPase domains